MLTINRQERRIAISTLFCLGMLPLFGCGEEEPVIASPVAGLYSITSYTQNLSACDTEGAPILDVSFLRIVHETALTLAPTVDVYECATENECADVSERYRDWSFEQETTTGWTTTVSTSSYGVSSCLLSLSESTLLMTDAGVTLDRKSYSAVIEMDETECQSDAIPTYRDQLSCVEYRVLLAERLED